MHLSMLLDMAAEGFGDRVAVGSKPDGLTFSGLRDAASRAAAWLAARDVERVGLVDVNSVVLPILLYASAHAGLPFVPVNYRLGDDQLRAILTRTAPSVVVVDDVLAGRVGSIEGVELVPVTRFLAELAASPSDAVPAPDADPDDIAVLLFTSGTTGEPKAAVLRHKHLGSYVIGTVDFMGASADEAAMVSVPPYHIAGISAVLTSVYSGRRIVYLPAFTPDAWVALARDEAVTQAMVVPTMLGRVLDVLERDGDPLPHLRHLAYGGGRMPVPVIERALAMLPHVDFVNAYGLTETSSTIAVLTPDDHRIAVAATAPPAVRRRLGSVGRPLPTVEVEIRDPYGIAVDAGEPGEIWVRGEQVAGEYLDRSGTTTDGWFPTRDEGVLDDGYLYLAGRLDDVIVRGGENMSPREIEDVLVAHPAVADVAVVGLPDTEWGEKVVAAVVVAEGATVTEAELQAWVKISLRSSKVPQDVAFRDALPYNETGKLLRRVLRSELAALDLAHREGARSG